MSNIVETALDKKTFSVLDVVTGAAYPTDTVTIYTDHESAYKIRQLEVADSTEEDPEKSNERAEQIAQLRQKVKDSGLTFHVRGYPPQVTKDIHTEAQAKFKLDAEEPGDPNKAAEWAVHKGLAEAIVKVEKSDGSVDEHKWTPEEVGQFRGMVLESEFDRLFLKTQEVIFAGIAFDSAVNADF